VRISKEAVKSFKNLINKVAFAKLYDRQNALITADMLNDQVVPFFEQQELGLLRVLTDRGTEILRNKRAIQISALFSY